MKTVLGLMAGFAVLCVLNIFYQEAYAYQTHCYKAMGTRYCESY